MQIIIQPDGNPRCVYAEVIDIAQLGRVNIRRGSHVEPNDASQWIANLSPVGGPLLGPFALRSQALNAERHWLETNWLPSAGLLAQQTPH
jgi:hypothetical protein